MAHPFCRTTEEDEAFAMFIRTYSRKGLTDESWRWVVIYESLKAERKEARRIRFVLWSTPQRTMYLNSQFLNRM